ncbi:hypothetical protein GHT07_04975 [Caenimonas koreensis DSM 17982]|uniref:DUF1570 domain-containing protein n=1 Tax=Caenimonas koreensis DSM 17982 TaxID=1121255 RepID=A0A844AW62_9BURK|nr:hypothetical protein [Caenimonas koreensis]MRD46618.1 hypothetical protein [Caenimonas koreensis DSM 17982]
MLWRADASLPIPDWSKQPWPEAGADEQLHAHANGLAAAWLDATIAALPVGHIRAESANFMLLSALQPRPTGVLLDYLERSRRRVLATLPGIAADQGHGKTVVMVFGDEEHYYQYIANYGGESSEPEAYSGGMFIDAGYGHFVFSQAPFESMEPVVVHELTHCLVRHLPIPAWLNEGLAVNTEHRFVAARPRYRANELQYLFDRFWNASTIQEFWSGKSFLRPDDGQPLSYELAKLLVQLLDKDFELLAQFCAKASLHDGGEDAAIAILGESLEELVKVVLGPGDWKPQPALWAAGAEKGQF